jgi:hypothetical protein
VAGRPGEGSVSAQLHNSDNPTLAVFTAIADPVKLRVCMVRHHDRSFLFAFEEAVFETTVRKSWRIETTLEVRRNRSWEAQAKIKLQKS